MASKHVVVKIPITGDVLFGDGDKTVYYPRGMFGLLLNVGSGIGTFKPHMPITSINDISNRHSLEPYDVPVGYFYELPSHYSALDVARAMVWIKDLGYDTYINGAGLFTVRTPNEIFVWDTDDLLVGWLYSVVPEAFK